MGDDVDVSRLRFGFLFGGIEGEGEGPEVVGGPRGTRRFLTASPRWRDRDLHRFSELKKPGEACIALLCI